MQWLSDNSTGITQEELWTEPYESHLERMLTRKKIIEQKNKAIERANRR